MFVASPVNAQNDITNKIAPVLQYLLFSDLPGAVDPPPQESYCSQFKSQTVPYFCEDFSNNSPKTLVGKIPPMSFRDQSLREYTKGEVFVLADPDQSSQHSNVINLHDNLIDGKDYSAYAITTANASKKWDITTHSRDGYQSPGTGPGYNNDYWWGESAFMGEHGKRCGAPVNLGDFVNSSRAGEKAYTFMERFFNIPASYNGDEKNLKNYWSAAFENTLTDEAGIHHIIRYEDMSYVCNDHLMTAVYGGGAAKLTLTPDHLLDSSSGKGVIEFSVSTYRTAGRDYWQLDLAPLETHLQLPEGAIEADGNGRAVNSLSINTQLNDGMDGPVELLGGLTVFRTLMMKAGKFLEQGRFINVDDPGAIYKRAKINSAGDPGRFDLYTLGPDTKWVRKDVSYNEVMRDYERANGNPSASLHSVTDNRKRARFRLTILKTPDVAVWGANPELWDQVSLCMPEFDNACVGDYIVPELPDQLLVQFTHFSYNTTKSCTGAGRQPGHVFQSTCHPNTYHWDDFYISPGKAFDIMRSTQRTASADSTKNGMVTLNFPRPAPAKSKLRFTALSEGQLVSGNQETSLQVSFDNGQTWFTPQRQYEPENDFSSFRPYFTGQGNSPYVPTGINKVLIKGKNAKYRDDFWVRDASLWSF